MLASSPAWLSAATSTLAYGVRKAGSPAVAVPRGGGAPRWPSHSLAAGLAFSSNRTEDLALPIVKYGRVITDTSDSSAGSTTQESWSSCAQVAPAPTSVVRRPPEATGLASRDVASVVEHAPGCGVSTRGQIHAACSCCGCEVALPPGQNGTRVRAAAVSPPLGAAACTWSGKTPNWS